VYGGSGFGLQSCSAFAWLPRHGPHMPLHPVISIVFSGEAGGKTYDFQAENLKIRLIDRLVSAFFVHRVPRPFGKPTYAHPEFEGNGTDRRGYDPYLIFISFLGGFGPLWGN